MQRLSINNHLERRKRKWVVEGDESVLEPGVCAQLRVPEYGNRYLEVTHKEIIRGNSQKGT